MPIILPTVHLNGTAKQDLVDQLDIARIALGVAVEALEDARPNARDYYPVGPDAFPRAQSEHQVRVLALRAVLEQLHTLHASVMIGPSYRQSENP
jgi:hypothetical protein